MRDGLRWLAAVAVTLGVLATPAHSALSPGQVAYWQRLGSCETGHIGLPDDGPARWNWGAMRRPLEGSVYEGGVGFAASTWRWWAGELGLLRRYPHAYQAPMLVQVRVADFGWRRYRGKWDCMPTVGRPPV